MYRINDYSYLKYTEDIAEEVDIGRRIINDNPQLYTRPLLLKIENILKMRGDIDIGLTDEQILHKSIYDFWVWGFSADELIFYHLLNADAKEKTTYISDQNRFNYYFHLNNKECVHLLNNKWEAYSAMPEAYKRDVICICGDEDKKVFFDFVSKHNDFCVKPSGASCGKGIHKESLSDYPDKNALFDKLISEKQSIKATEDNKFLVLEELIEQADVLSAFHPGSVNGVRLTTVNVNGKISFFTPWLKVGNNGAFVGTAAQGGFIAGIDAESGIVCTPGMSENGNSFDAHTLTGVKFEGTQLPDWKDLLDMAIELSLKLPMFGYIGWDFVPTKDRGWCVMEGNYGGQMLGQMIYRKGLKKEFEDIIGWTPNKTFWWE